MSPKPEAAVQEEPQRRSLLVLQSDLADSFDRVMQVVEEGGDEDAQQYAVQAFTLDLDRAEEKVDNIARLVRHTRALQEFHDDEARFHVGRSRVLENARRRVLDWVAVCAAQIGVKEFRGRVHKLRVQDNPPALQVREGAAIPEGFRTFKMDLGASPALDFDAIEKLTAIVEDLAGVVLEMPLDASPTVDANLLRTHARILFDEAHARRVVLDREAMKAALKAGADHDGYELTQGVHVRAS